MEKLLMKAGTAVIIIFILTIGSCTMHQDYRVSQAIENGVDPVLARTAYENGGGQYERIIYLASKKGEK